MTDVHVSEPTRFPSAAAFEALAADGPDPGLSRELALFGQFVGAWSFDGTLIDPDGVTRTHEGEWHFGWALEGRAVQDVLVVPPRAARTEGEESLCYGTTLRFFDSSLGAWRVVWADPVNNALTVLVAREEGAEIVIEGTTTAGRPVRWVWSEITEDSALWRGYRSEDEGATWTLGEEMRLRRLRDEA